MALEVVGEGWVGGQTEQRERQENPIRTKGVRCSKTRQTALLSGPEAPKTALKPQSPCF